MRLYIPLVLIRALHRIHCSCVCVCVFLTLREQQPTVFTYSAEAYQKLFHTK